MNKITLTLILLVHINVLGQTSISGMISSKDEAIPFANIYLESNKNGTSSDIDGFYKIPLNPGEYVLNVSALGYHSYQKKIKVKANESMILNVVLAKNHLNLDQVVVTGTLKETFIKSSPVKVEVISKTLLQKTPSNNIMEIIENVNGVQKKINCGVCGTSDIHINGMEGPYSLVLIDGMPIMSSLSTVYGLNGIPTSLIKQIEIIKGPSSTLYGTEAVAGVINVITKNASDIDKLEVATFISSDLEKNLDISWSPKWQNTDMLLSANIFEMNQFLDDNNDGFSDEVLSQRASIFNKWNFHRKSEKDFDLSMKYYHEDRFGGVKNWTEDFRGSDSIYGESIFTHRWEISSKYAFDGNEDIQYQFSYNYHDQDSYYGASHYKARQNTFFNQLVWHKNIGLKHQITSGLALKYDQYNDNTPATNSAEKSWIPGAFIQNEITITDRWNVLIGMRWDEHKDHGSILAPRFNLKWSVKDNLNIRLNTGTGFRVVHLFTEDHAALTGSREVIINEALQPEESTNINLNINHWFNTRGHNTSIDFDLFYTHFNNKIVPDYDSDPSFIYYNNLEGYSISKGMSFQINQNFKRPLSISFGGTYLDVYSVNNSNPDDELFVPEFSGVFSLGYQWPNYGLKIDYTGRIIGSMKLPSYEEKFNRAETSPWYTIQDVKIQKDISKSLEAFFGVKNIFNYKQESPLIDPTAGSDINGSWEAGFSPNFDTAYVYAPTRGRRFIVGLCWVIG